MAGSARSSGVPVRARARFRRRIALAAFVAAAVVGSAPAARAREIDTGVPELRLRFDNTLRFNLGVRAEAVDTVTGSNPAFTAGEYSVPQGGITTSRLDLLSELDLAYAGRFGGRISGAGWYDAAYQDGTVTRSPALGQVPGTYLRDELSDYTLHRYRGPWGELLDAFVFARFAVRDVPVAVNVGRHAVYWGESLMAAGATHGICYSQMPLDLQKAWATPGLEAKELFRPLANVSISAQLAPELSIAAQYFLEWESYVYPEGGTFLGPADFAFNGPAGVFRPIGGAPAFLENGGVSRPPDTGEWGLALRWSPRWLDGTLGLYARRYTDKVAAALLSTNPGGTGPLSPQLGAPYEYRQYYAEDVGLLGVSLAKQVLGVSVGAEVSFRHDTPLLAQSLGFVVAPAPPLAPLLFPGGLPELRGNSYQARGDTLHGVLNGVAIVSGRGLFSTASIAVELTHSRWLDVTANPDMFYGEGYGVCRRDAALASAGLARGRSDGCATRGHLALGAGFTPTWYRVASGLDLQAPFALAWTIAGNSPVTLGGNEGSGTWSAGIAADLRNKYRLELRYVDFFGDTSDDGTTLTSTNGLVALLQHRGSVTLTAKATF